MVMPNDELEMERRLAAGNRLPANVEKAKELLGMHEPIKDIIPQQDAPEAPSPAKKRFDRETFFRNLDYLLPKLGKKLGELESSSGNSPGYLSRMKSGKVASDPSIEFIMAASEELQVPMDLLVSADLSNISGTEKFVMEFLHRLISDTQADRIAWERETAAELNGMEVDYDYAGDPYVRHPLFSVVIDRYNGEKCEVAAYNSLFFHNRGVRILGDCFHAELPGTGNQIYVMDCGKGDDKRRQPVERFFELYLWDHEHAGNPVRKLCNTLAMSSSVIMTVNNLIKSILSSLGRIHIEEDVRDVISAYMRGTDADRDGGGRTAKN